MNVFLFHFQIAEGQYVAHGCHCSVPNYVPGLSQCHTPCPPGSRHLSIETIRNIPSLKKFTESPMAIG
jgi:hypothetical protein